MQSYLHADCDQELDCWHNLRSSARELHNVCSLQQQPAMLDLPAGVVLGERKRIHGGGFLNFFHTPVLGVYWY